MKVLIIEDEADISRFLSLELEHEGYETTAASNGRDGLRLALSDDFDIVLLDVMLPEISGIEVLRRLRQTKDVPVILLTARDSVADKVTGLDMGANDYVTKPFHVEELLARIRATVRGTSRKDAGVCLSACDMELNTQTHTVKRAGKELPLTKKEFDLLEYFMRNKNIVLTRDRLLDTVWGYDFAGDSNIVDVYVRYLRSKLNDGSGTQYISTIRGVGYVLKDEQ